MFAVQTNAVVKKIGADTSLISNPNMDMKVDLLSLVKVKKGGLWQLPKYKEVMCTLPELLEEAEFSPEVDEEVLVENFLRSLTAGGEVKLGGGHPLVGVEAEVGAKGDTVDAQVEPVDITKKTANVKPIRKKFSGRRIQQDKLKQLRLKKNDKLAFVFKKVYNTRAVELKHESNLEGNVSGSYQKMVTLLFKANRTDKTGFKIPEKTTFAYGLMEIMLEDDKIEIPLEPWTHKRTGFMEDAVDPQILKKVQDGIEMKEGLLEPLAGLSESTRLDLIKNLQAVLEDEDDLCQLEDLLGPSKGASERPSSEVVSSFMDLVKKSKVKDPLYVLVSAMSVLPNELLQPLISCSLETLKILSEMVESLKEDGEVTVPDSLPAPLQKEGNLRVMVELLSTTDGVVEEMSTRWNLPPEVLLEVLALTVMGLNHLKTGN